MSAGHNDAKLLYSIGNIHAFHIQDGSEQSLTPSGPQTLSLLMVPTSSPFADLSSTEPNHAEDDFYLHLHLPPEIDLSLPATTQIFHQPPRSYLIPRWDLGPSTHAFTRIEFPKVGSGPDRVTQDDIDTFETILAQCTAFLERAKPPVVHKSAAAYNPADWAPGEGYVGIGSEKPKGQIVLIDEEDGSVVGELGEGYDVVPSKDVRPGSKNPVEITLPQDGQGRIAVDNVSDEYLNMARLPAYKNSTIVQNAAVASRLIVTGSNFLANSINSGAMAFTQKTKPASQPMTFSVSTQERIRKINHLTHGAVGLSASTVGQVGKMAQNLGARMARRSEAKRASGSRAPAAPAADYKPGMLNKSMIAFSTIADGIEQSAKQLLTSGSTAASTVVGHRYGMEAGEVAAQLAGGVKNVGLVYVDATGVSRRAILKSVAKGMVVGRVPGGGHVVVGDGDGGTVPPEMLAGARSDAGAPSTVGNQTLPGTGQPGAASRPGETVVGFGAHTAGAPGSGVGEPLSGQALQGQEAYQYPREKY